MIDNNNICLNDLIGLYKYYLDSIQKFWNYMLVAGAAASTAALTIGKLDPAQPGLGYMLLTGFAVYAVVNLLVLTSDQREARLLVATIRSAVSPNTSNLQVPILRLKAAPLWLAAVSHVVVDIFFVAVIYMACHLGPT
jgi:hypothetical protein